MTNETQVADEPRPVEHLLASSHVTATISAALCAALRPRLARVFVFTPDARLARRLRYALEPIVLPFSEQPKDTMQAAENVLLERTFLAPGAKVVFVTDILDQDKRISSVQVRVVGGNGG
jgi:pyruvate kinase